MDEADELLELMRRVGDELGEEVYESAQRRAGAVARASHSRAPGSVEDPAAPLVNVGAGDEECLVPKAAYLDALKTELRRLLRPH